MDCGTRNVSLPSKAAIWKCTDSSHVSRFGFSATNTVNIPLPPGLGAQWLMLFLDQCICFSFRLYCTGRAFLKWQNYGGKSSGRESAPRLPLPQPRRERVSSRGVAALTQLWLSVHGDKSDSSWLPLGYKSRPQGARVTRSVVNTAWSGRSHREGGSLPALVVSSRSSVDA